MKFISVRELRMRAGDVWKSLRMEGELVLTSNGQPVALITPVTGDNLEDELKALRRARATLALERLRNSARESGADKLSPEEIASEIKAVRRGGPALSGSRPGGRKK